MRKLALIVGCLLYVLSPIDLIPDFVPIAGQADDLTLIILTIRALLKPAEEAAS